MKSAAIRPPREAFVPQFGPRGELRQTIGRSGRVHIDRWLPFLVLHRSDEPESSIARRVAVNSPAYLIWASEDDAEASEALVAIAAALRDALGPILLIEIEDAPWRAQPKDAPELPPFVVHIAAAGGRGALRALDTLRKACGDVEVDLRRATVDTDAPVEPHGPGGDGDGADRLRMTIPPIHRGPDGRPYPRLTHELAVALGDALLRAAAAFMEGSPGAPLHYRALGRSAFLAAALHADRKLDAIARSYDFLLSLTPINTAEAMHLFLEGQAERAPEFRYRPLTVDPDLAKRDLYEIDLALLEDPTLERLLCAKRRELDYQLTMLATRNTPGFRPASQLLYGGVDPQLLSDAHALLASDGCRAPTHREAAVVRAEEIAAAARELVGRYRRADERFDATVEVRDDVSGLIVSGRKLMIASDSRVANGRVDPLLAHEVSVHLLTCCNGGAQGLTIFRTGLAHYEGIQEGLGVFAEWAVGGLTRLRIRLLAGRVVAVDAMLAGADFIETWRRLTRDLGFTRPTAFNIAMRVFRSGGFAKDAIYLRGFRQVVDLVAAGASLDPFWLGKIAPEDLEAVEELLLRKLLQPPVFKPEFLAREDAQRRIARLRGGLPFDRILDLE